MLQTTVIGYLGNDATIKDVNGRKVINFSVAHTERFKNGQGVQVERTTWVECALWEKEGVAPYLKKGTQVYCQGAPESRGWLDKAGQPQSSLVLNVFKLELLGSKKQDVPPTQQHTQNNAKTEALQAAGVDPVDDLPF